MTCAPRRSRWSATWPSVPPTRAGLLAADGLLPLVVRLVASDEASTKAIVRTAAIRALAILGESLTQLSH